MSGIGEMIISRTQLRTTRDHDGYTFHYKSFRVLDRPGGSVVSETFQAPLLGLKADSLQELKRKATENGIREGVGAAAPARLCTLEG